MFENFQVAQDLMPSDPRFGVGPSLVSSKAVKVLVDAVPGVIGTSHRQKPVKDVCKEIQSGLTEYFNLPKGYEVIMGNGGATFLFDMIGLGLVEHKSYHYVLGEFSEKWFNAHDKIPWIEAQKYSVPYGEGMEVKNVSAVDMICCTLNETSTGVMISEFPDVGEKTLLAVDATSGAGQIKVDFNKVDVYFFSPQKVFAAEGGFYCCIMSPKAIQRAEKLMNRSTYTPEIMSWEHAIVNSRKHQTYNTPAISSLILLNEQIKVMNGLGEDKIVELAQKKADYIYDWAMEKDYLSPFVETKRDRSVAVATIDVEDKYRVEDLEKRLRELGVAYDIGGYRKLGRNQLRISLFHNVELENLKKLCHIISLAIETERAN